MTTLRDIASNPTAKCPNETGRDEAGEPKKNHCDVEIHISLMPDDISMDQ